MSFVVLTLDAQLAVQMSLADEILYGGQWSYFGAICFVFESDLKQSKDMLWSHRDYINIALPAWNMWISLLEG